MEQNYSHIDWKITGTWGSFISFGLMRFSWPAVVHFKEQKTQYLTIASLRGLYKNIVQNLKNGTIYEVSIKVHFEGDDLSEERKERYVKVMNEYMEKYGIVSDFGEE